LKKRKRAECEGLKRLAAFGGLRFVEKKKRKKMMWGGVASLTGTLTN
jgi:hypothetical protein